MLDIGIIGLGNMGSSYVSQIGGGTVDRLKLKAVCDIDPERLERFKDFETFTDADEMIRSGLVEAVMIVTPHYFHTTIGIAALERGLHVLVDKPISVHKADCERLIAAHKDEKQVFAAMFNLRTSPQFRKIKQLVHDGELGGLQRINWIATNWFRSETYYASGGWRATWKGEGGGVLLNQCPHNLDMFQWIFGMPARVRAFCGFGKYHNIETEDEVTAYMEFENGATGVFVATTGEAPGTDRLEIAGDRGKLVYEHGKIAFTRNETPTREFSKVSTSSFGTPNVWNVEIPTSGQGGQHIGILKNFVAAVLDGAALIAPAKEGLHSVELANAMIYSSLTEQTVELPLDGEAYEKKLNELVAGSTFEKKVRERTEEDMTKSFK